MIDFSYLSQEEKRKNNATVEENEKRNSFECWDCCWVSCTVLETAVWSCFASHHFKCVNTRKFSSNLELFQLMQCLALFLALELFKVPKFQLKFWLVMFLIAVLT